MRWLTERLVVLMTVAFVVFTVAQASDASTLLVVGTLALAVAMLVVARTVVLTAVGRSITVGRRARNHREPLSELPSPQHPNTAGLSRSRAPAQSPPAP